MTCVRQESTNKWYHNTVKDLLLMSMAAKRMNKLHTIGLDDTAKHIKI